MRAALWTAVFAALLLTACGEENPFGDASTGRPDASMPGDGGRPPGDGGTNTSPDVTPVTRDSGGTTISPDAACAMQTSDTTRAPMNLLIVLDRSGSMADSGKWTAAVSGINRLITLLPDDTRVGLMLFPALSNPSSETGYANPVVPIAPLTTSRAMIMSRLVGTSPSGGTPMACAMLGAVGHYSSMFSMDGSRNIILITDGAPTEECSGTTCDLFDINCHLSASNQAKLRIQATVSSGAMRMPQIRTYVVATPDADPAFLSNLATNGRTERMPGCGPTTSCHYSLATGTFEMDLNRALDDIRGRAATCEFRIMVDTTMADPNLINVTFTPSSGAPPRTIPRDVTHTNGWDYSADRTTVILYGPICDEVRSNTTGGRVQILYGCPTQVPG